jgi:cytidine deaminase
MSEFNTENVIVVHNDEIKKYKFEEVLPFDFKF